MTFADVFDRLPSHGWLTRDEADLLWRAASAASGPFLEIGSYHGRSAVLLGNLAATRETHLYCVDPWDDTFTTDLPGAEIYRRFLANVEGLPIVVCRCRVENWRECPEVGLAYLDGDHSYEGTRLQLRKAIRCRAGVIAVHDVNDDGQGAEIKRACLEMLGPWRERVGRLAVWAVSVPPRRNGLVELS